MKVVILDTTEEADKLGENIKDLSVADGEPHSTGLKKKRKKQVEPDFTENKNGSSDEDGSKNQLGDDEEDENTDPR